MTACPACASDDLLPLVDVAEVPVLCNGLYPDREQARAAPTGRLDMRFCRHCGHMHNAAYDPSRLRYSVGYDASLAGSPSFVRYTEGLAAGLIARHRLRGARVLEIGCGQGDFLRLLRRLGGITGIGFDPSCEAEDGDGLAFRREYYDQRHGGEAVDLVCSRHVLEHIPRPADFLAELRHTLAQRRDTTVFFEVPNGLFTLRDFGIWDLIYEHCSYFTASSLTAAFARAGFAVEAVAETFGGQFLTLEAHPAEPSPCPVDAPVALAKRFAQAHRDILAGWRTRLQEWSGPTMIWGSGSKGVSFLNLVGRDRVAAAIDVNPRKHGRFVAGTGHPILAPEEAARLQPRRIIVMNPLYVDEIAAQAAALGMDCDIISVDS